MIRFGLLLLVLLGPVCAWAAEDPFVAVRERKKLLTGCVLDIWPDAAEQATDHSGNARHGTYVNSPTIEPAEGRRRTYKFSTADASYISLSNHVAAMSSLEDWTIIVRYQLLTTGNQTLFSIYDTNGANCLQIKSRGSGAQYAHVRCRRLGSTILDMQTGFTLGPPVVGSYQMHPFDGRMHDLVISRSAANGIKIYVDGIQVDSPTYTTGDSSVDIGFDNLSGLSNVTISRGNYGGTTTYSDANVARVQVFDHQLNDDELLIARFLGMMIVGLGQSNYTGYENDDGNAVLNAPNPEIHDMIRSGTSTNYRWEVLTEPINGANVPSNSNSMAFPLAKRMLPLVKAVDPFGEVYMPTVAEPGSGFVDNHWNAGDATYNNAITRINYAIRQGCVVAAVVWQGGENDSYTEDAANAQPAAFRDFHTAICSDVSADQLGTLDQKVWLLGAMTSHHRASGIGPAIVDANTIALADEYQNMAYTSSDGIPSINIHYSAASIRKMAERHWQNFQGEIHLRQGPLYYHTVK